MKRFALVRQVLMALSLGCVAWPCSADDDCDAPVRLWQSREAAHQMAVAQGWQVQRLKIDDGCYEIRGIDAQGRAFKAKIDPQTLAIVKIKHKERDGERGRRQGERAQQPAAVQPDAARADNTGARPRAPASAAAPRTPLDP